MLQSTATDKCSRCFRALEDSGHCSRVILFTPFAYMCGLSFWKPEHMLSNNAGPLHFRSSVVVGLHVAGHGGASDHALAVRDRRVHRCGGCHRRQQLLSNGPCGHQSVPCSVRLARAAGHFIQQLYMQIPLGDLHASAISLLAYINLLGVSVPDVWKRDAEHASIGARVSSLCFRARFYIGGI